MSMVTDELDETALEPETSVDELDETVTDELDETALEPESSVDAVYIPSFPAAASHIHYSEGNIKMLTTLEEEACTRFPFNSVYHDLQDLKSAVRIWSESVGASISHQDIDD
jgi:hypothetical protein